MVLRLSSRRTCLLISTALAVLFCLPYFSSDFLALEHDTLFHLSRIEGLAEAIRNGDLLPALYPYKNNGFGYASPLFYCDLLLFPFSLLYLAGVSLALSYKLVIFCATLMSVYAVLRLTQRCVRSPYAAVAVTAAFCFSNYRITDVYVRGALGEMMAIGFFAVCISALFELIEKDNPSGGTLLWTGLCGLIFTHNLTFAFGAVSVAVITLLCAGRISSRCVRAGFTAVILAFLCTAWFTLPMLEQLHDQRFILHYYASSSRLEQYALPLWKYFANKTVFGYGDNMIEPDRQMLVNIGYAITLLALLFPITAFHNKKLRHSGFIWSLWGLGMVCLILPCDIFPWSMMSALRVLQFPWRLMTPALVLLTVPAACALEQISYSQKWPSLLLCAAVLSEGAVHLYPAFSRPFGITSKTGYQDIISGALIDPYYSATYMRVELAGGDYLPDGSPDFRIETPAVRDSSGAALITDYEQDWTAFRFTINSIPADGFLELPLTYYKGYECTVNGNPVPVESSSRKLVSIRLSETGTVTVQYQGTLLRRICIPLSLVSLLAALLIIKKDFFRSPVS